MNHTTIDAAVSLLTPYKKENRVCVKNVKNIIWE